MVGRRVAFHLGIAGGHLGYSDPGWLNVFSVTVLPMQRNYPKLKAIA
jgi:hypothetical protein